MKEEINLIITGNSDYFALAPAFFTNFCDYHKDYAVTLYVFCDELAPKYLSDLAKIADFYHQNVVNIKIGSHEFEFLKNYRVGLDMWPKQSYYYLLAGKYLPDETITRALYCDLDISFFADSYNLYMTDFSDKWFVAQTEAGSLPLETITDEQKRRGSVANSGVLLLNLTALREHNINGTYFENQLSQLSETKVTYRGQELDFFADQGLFSYVFANQIKFFNTDLIRHEPPYNNAQIAHFSAAGKKMMQGKIADILTNEDRRYIYQVERYKILSAIILEKINVEQTFELYDKGLSAAISHSDFILSPHKMLYYWQPKTTKFLGTYFYEFEGLERVFFRFSSFFSPKQNQIYQIKLVVKASQDIPDFGVVGLYQQLTRRVTQGFVKADEVTELTAEIDFKTTIWEGFGFSSHSVSVGTVLDIIDIAIEEKED
ncbi:hypothetical protein Hs30E_15100 [Lactococcus hodotermopsidis]|uniref:Glycosyl transferase n=1 Tax=Pseudolactococcus hodotermopsidis TaxID=2709157 RepID=A0A6A0BBY7_9LACT|nr:glycosyltransferase [Lactococcus hodotermopsidis]GFH42959.1 hypothetical protein Hs30E_15100 [Lactococcus hodotermopsidis]